MKTSQAILNEITQLTATIESQYPELYRHLDENPITLKNGKTSFDPAVFQNYLECLRELLRHHIEHYKLMEKS